MSEVTVLNPSQKMSQQMEGQYQKLLAVLIHKLGGSASLSLAEIEAACSTKGGLFLTMKGRGDAGIDFELVDEKTAKELLKKVGGEAH